MRWRRNETQMKLKYMYVASLNEKVKSLPGGKEKEIYLFTLTFMYNTSTLFKMTGSRIWKYTWDSLSSKTVWLYSLGDFFWKWVALASMQHAKFHGIHNHDRFEDIMIGMKTRLCMMITAYSIHYDETDTGATDRAGCMTQKRELTTSKQWWENLCICCHMIIQNIMSLITGAARWLDKHKCRSFTICMSTEVRLDFDYVKDCRGR